MATHKTRFNFKGRPDRACSDDDLRPAMTYIYVDQGNMVATNGNILVMVPLEISDILGEKDLLNGCYIHPMQYMDMLKYDMLKVTEKAEITATKRCYSQSFTTVFKLKTEADFDVKFPSYKNAMEFEAGAVAEIGVATRQTMKLLSCFDGLCVTGNFKLEFQSPSRGIRFTSEEHSGLIGLLMPVMLKDA